jgi:hypothetical protein
MRVEKRRNPRDRVNWPVRIQTEAGTLERVAYNIGSDGSFISGFFSLEPQEVVGMIIRSPGSPIKVKARVVWSRSQVHPEENMPRGVGVKFIEISDQDREFISSFILGSNFALYLEPLISNEDRERLIVEGILEEEKKGKNKPAKGPPQKCPRGHKHLSWSADEDYLFCWDCNGRYPLAECFDTHEIILRSYSEVILRQLSSRENNPSQIEF